MLLQTVLVGFIGFGLGLSIMSSERYISNEVPSYPFFTRSQWYARTPKESPVAIVTPVPYVVVHHSYTPGACHCVEECTQAMRAMQNFHMDDRKWCDIGYNFGVGSDGSAYEGRGWNVTGAHALHFNDVSIGICLIGDWTNSLPPAQQLKTAQALIATGVSLGFVSPNYKLLGHRQVRETECPGDALFQNIQTWNHWSKYPASVKELKSVPELPKRIKDLLNSA